MRRALTAFLMLTGLSACARGGLDPEFCQIAAPILISPQDQLTPETAAAILKHDEVGAALCGWG